MKQLRPPFSLPGLFLLLLSPGVLACTSPATVCFDASVDSFPLIADGRPVPVLSDRDADSAVQRVAASFVEDLNRVSGGDAQHVQDPAAVAGSVVVIGELGKSELLDDLVRAGKLDPEAMEGKWEAFSIQVVEEPWPGVPQALVIAGSDRRGAVFGTYDLSERIGVSPWHWFADVAVAQRSDVFVTPGIRTEQPGIRYRGFFINDEAPAFSGWSGQLFGGANADMYEHVFELLLRMKGNYIWPAMWAPRAFHLDDPRNAELAHSMGVVMGTSHHEPLTRAQDEWHRFPDDPAIGGEWDYRTNAGNLRSFWRGALERMMSPGNGESYDNLLTVGMRGDGDEPMARETAIDLLETIVADQRTLIEEVTGRPAAEVPQVWALYKEVQDYYDQGMTVPDDVTLLFADDNWGQIRRLPTQDVDRAGGYGVYYHFDYVGAPRNYKWLNTNQIGKIWQQMNLAYERGARNVWVVNVGDIKPMEYPLDFFLKMAWSPDEMTPAAVQAFPQQWATMQFGDELAADAAALITAYSRLAARRKPELVNQDTYATGEIRPDVLVRGRYSLIVDDWRQLIAELESVSPRVPEAKRDAWFQLVEFPILALGNLYEMYFATAWNHRLAAVDDPRANVFLRQVEAAYARDAELTGQYHSLNGGKWDQMMSQVHMNYRIWQDPPEQTMPAVIAVAADVPEPMRNSPVQFVDAAEEAAGVLSLAAADFDRSIEAGGLTWTAVPDLGQSGAALVALPQGLPSTTAGQGPRVEYDVSIPANNGIGIRLRLAPTLDTYGDQGLRIGVSVDDGPIETLSWYLEPTGGGADTPGKRRWYDAVIDNRVVLTVELGPVPAGERTVKLWRLDDNVVPERIELEPL